jgi:hypothetical protein
MISVWVFLADLVIRYSPVPVAGYRWRLGEAQGPTWLFCNDTVSAFDLVALKHNEAELWWWLT